MKNVEMYIESFKMKRELFFIGCDSLEEMGLWNKKALGEMDEFYSSDLASIVIRLIATDGKVTQKEVDYLNETFGFAYTIEQLTDVYDTCKDNIGESFDENFENGITYMRQINTRLADAYKELLFLICQIIIESDGIVAESEIAEIKRLQAMCE